MQDVGKEERREGGGGLESERSTAQTVKEGRTLQETNRELRPTRSQERAH